ncbi:MAG: phosphotransferase [Chloroflexi bacterium]|nr:phosphotransferase [Chloroflexota bacterium]
MPNIALKDILINARQESYRMQHYYLGVEHLFIGLLDIQGGLTSSLLEERGLTTEYVVDAIRRKAGKGNRQRLWAGMPNTPRADVVLGIANDLALEGSSREISERDLLVAILDENDSIPVRVLRKFEVDTDQLSHDARTKALNYQQSQPYIKIDFGQQALTLPEETLFILRRMFYGYSQIRVDRRLTGGFTSAVILVVTPIAADGMEDAAVVVKIDDADMILDEAQRYETHVKSSLPPLTARLEDKPTTSETSDMAGIKYTFIAGMNRSAQDLREAAQDLDNLGEWLRRELYPYFGKTWWKQNRPYRFQVWTEYDWLLPPLLTLDYMPEEEIPTTAALLRDPLRRTRINKLEYGDPVLIENFTVQRVYHDKNMIQVSVGKGSEAARRAYKINIRGLNLSEDAYYRGEIIERIGGRVWETRAAALMAAAQALEPDFDLKADTIPGIGKPERLPNPIFAHDDLLDRYVDGTLSKIHGDLHLGNILVGPNASAFLIDFAQTRNGHTLFDWASLEVSLLTDVVMPVIGDDWWSVRLVLRYIASLQKDLPDTVPALNEVMQHVLAVREIARECLAREGSWSEYYVALAMCALRAYTWETVSLGARRLMFCLAGLGIHELRSRGTLTMDDGPITDFLGDRTEFN